MMKQSPQTGFTLIELSIVLVVIGLIVGGVLVGRDLIAAAGLRRVVSQLEQYKASMYAFKSKFNYLPGDLPASQASQLGMTARSGNTCEGDGDGMICAEEISMPNGTQGIDVYLGVETQCFWTDLSTAQMTDGQFKSNCQSTTASTPAQIDALLPRVKFTRPGWIIPMSHFLSADNYFFLGSVTSIGAYTPSEIAINWNASGANGPAGILTPGEAFQLDQKLDDGNPFTGNLTASGHAGWYQEPSPMYLDGADASPLNGVCNWKGVDGLGAYNLAYPDYVDCNLYFNIR